MSYIFANEIKTKKKHTNHKKYQKYGMKKKQVFGKDKKKIL
jgi:hypothetical protein